MTVTDINSLGILHAHLRDRRVRLARLRRRSRAPRRGAPGHRPRPLRRLRRLAHRGRSGGRPRHPRRSRSPAGRGRRVGRGDPPRLQARHRLHRRLQGRRRGRPPRVDTFGDALAGTDRPFVLAAGLVGLAPGRVATERDMPKIDGSPISIRSATALAALALASRGVRSSVVRLSPTCHGEGDNGFMATLVSLARARVSPATSATTPAAGPPSTASTPHGCSTWRWRRPRPDQCCTVPRRKASRSATSPR